MNMLVGVFIFICVLETIVGLLLLANKRWHFLDEVDD